MTVVDHPARHVAQLNERIASELGGLVCWQAGLLWDSYLALEFGERRTFLGKDGPVDMGEFRIVLDEAFWFAERGSDVVVNSDDIPYEGVEELISAAFVGSRLLRVEAGRHFSLIFSDGVALRCRCVDPDQEADEKLLELRFAGGDYVDCYASGFVETESTGA